METGEWRQGNGDRGISAFQPSPTVSPSLRRTSHRLHGYPAPPAQRVPRQIPLSPFPCPIEPSACSHPPENICRTEPRDMEETASRDCPTAGRVFIGREAQHERDGTVGSPAGAVSNASQIRHHHQAAEPTSGGNVVSAARLTGRVYGPGDKGFFSRNCFTSGTISSCSTSRFTRGTRATRRWQRSRPGCSSSAGIRSA